MGHKLESFCALEALLLGAWLISPFWDTFSSNTAFAEFAQLAPEHVWGLGGVVVGLAQILAIRYGGPRSRFVLGAVSLFFYSTGTVLFALGNFRSLDVVSFAMFTAMAGIALYEISRNLPGSR